MRPVEVDLEVLKELHKKGYTDEAIAQKLDISRATVIRKREELGLPPNRRRGERGPGKVQEEKSYYAEILRLMKYVGKEIYSAAVEYLAQTGDESRAWLAIIVDPCNVPHPMPGPYSTKPEKMDIGTAKFICGYERKADMAGMAGVPGPAIIELAKVYKTADEEAKKKLAMKAVIEAGYVRICEKVKEVIKKGTAKVREWKQIWEQRLKAACDWAPVKLEKPKTFLRTFAGYYSRMHTGTGQLGTGGGIRNIQTRRAWLGAAGY